jgi:uncharacterized membrane protein
MIGMIAFWGPLTLALWYIFTGGSCRADQNQTPATGARQILDERLAQGEIDPDQHRHLRDLMTGDPTATSD